MFLVWLQLKAVFLNLIYFEEKDLSSTDDKQERQMLTK